jgi:hypothetical protein
LVAGAVVALGAEVAAEAAESARPTEVESAEAEVAVEPEQSRSEAAIVEDTISESQ